MRPRGMVRTRLYQPLTKRDQNHQTKPVQGELFTYFQWVNGFEETEAPVSSFLLSASRPLKVRPPITARSSASGLQSQKQQGCNLLCHVSGFDAVDIQAVIP